jgi:hypothetical protein
MQKKTDVLLSIHPIHMANIAARIKTHEFRKYLIPNSVNRMWFYTTAPAQRLQYIAVIGKGKEPGEIDATDTGLGNEDFNTGRKVSGYGYEILELYEMENPLSLSELVDHGFIKGAPQKYQWISEEMLSSISLENQKKLF